MASDSKDTVLWQCCHCHLWNTHGNPKRWSSHDPYNFHGGKPFPHKVLEPRHWGHSRLCSQQRLVAQPPTSIESLQHKCFFTLSHPIKVQVATPHIHSSLKKVAVGWPLNANRLAKVQHLPPLHLQGKVAHIQPPLMATPLALAHFEKVLVCVCLCRQEWCVCVCVFGIVRSCGFFGYVPIAALTC